MQVFLDAEARVQAAWLYLISNFIYSIAKYLSRQTHACMKTPTRVGRMYVCTSICIALGCIVIVVSDEKHDLLRSGTVCTHWWWQFAVILEQESRRVVLGYFGIKIMIQMHASWSPMARSSVIGLVVLAPRPQADSSTRRGEKKRVSNSAHHVGDSRGQGR